MLQLRLIITQPNIPQLCHGPWCPTHYRLSALSEGFYFLAPLERTSASPPIRLRAHRPQVHTGQNRIVELRQNIKVVSMNLREFTGFELCCIDWKVQGFTSWQLITITYMLNSTILKSLLGVYEAASTYMSLVHQLWHADRVGYLCICTWPSAIGAHRDSWTVIGGNNSYDRQVKECRKCRLLMYFRWNEAKNARISL